MGDRTRCTSIILVVFGVVFLASGILLLVLGDSLIKSVVKKVERSFSLSFEQTLHEERLPSGMPVATRNRGVSVLARSTGAVVPVAVRLRSWQRHGLSQWNGKAAPSTAWTFRLQVNGTTA